MTGHVSPTSQSNTSSMTIMKKSQPQGPCYLKMLVSNLVAGSIIGKSGSVIANIESTTGVTMKLSTANQFFPGTTDRIVVMSGSLDQLNQAVIIILDKIGDVTLAQYVPESEQNRNCQFVCKIVVPKSAVSGIIGKGGHQIQGLQESSKAKIKISNRELGLNERVVSITGSLENIQSAALTITHDIQEDPYLKDYMNVSYQNTIPSVVPNVSASGMNPLAAFGQFVHTGGSSGPHYPYTTSYPSNNNISATCAPLPMADLESLMNEMCEVSIEVPDTYIGYLIGKSGACLLEIMKSTNATIKLSPKGDLIPGTQMRKVTISGSLSSVHRAHARIIHRVRETQQHTARSMSVDSNPSNMLAGNTGYHMPTSAQQMSGSMNQIGANHHFGNMNGTYGGHHASFAQAHQYVQYQ